MVPKTLKAPSLYESLSGPSAGAAGYSPYASLGMQASTGGAMPQNDAELQSLAERTRDRLAGDSTVGNPIIRQFTSAVQTYYNQSQSPLAQQMLGILKDKGHL